MSGATSCRHSTMPPMVSLMWLMKRVKRGIRLVGEERATEDMPRHIALVNDNGKNFVIASAARRSIAPTHARPPASGHDGLPRFARNDPVGVVGVVGVAAPQPLDGEERGDAAVGQVRNTPPV